MKLGYVILYVKDMDRAVTFHREKLGLTANIVSPFWSEFDTGDTRLALHPANGRNAPGTVQLGYHCEDLDALYDSRETSGLVFTEPPTFQRGVRLATILDSEGRECRVRGL